MISYNSNKFGRSLNAPFSICFTLLWCNFLRGIYKDNKEKPVITNFENIRFRQIQLPFKNKNYYISVC